MKHQPWRSLKSFGLEPWADRLAGPRSRARIAVGILLLLGLLIGVRSSFLGSPSGSERVIFYQGAPCAEGEILVKFKRGVSRSAIVEAVRSSNGQDLEVIPGIDVHKVGILSAGLSRSLAAFRRDPRVEFAEPDYSLHLASVVPTDPYFVYQWALRNTGQAIAPLSFGLSSGTPGADIKAAEAWTMFQGSPETVVAVVDTGVDLVHPDLANRILSSGIDFVNNDDSAQDDHGHGTHVAGIIAAEANNGQGVSGVNWNVRILPVKVFNRSAVGQTSWVADGIIYAASHGARVINMSLGGRDVIVNQTLEMAVKFAYDQGAVLVAAAGNNGTAGVWYPAAYKPYVIAAAATDQNDRRVTLESTGQWGSNTGPEVDVAAPGIDIISTWPFGLPRRGHPGFPGYVYDWGTSMSTAYVSGLSALIISYRPDLTNREVMTILRLSADDVNGATLPGPDEELGYGRIDAARALSLVSLWDYLGRFLIHWPAKSS
jgi:thermitase